MGDVGGRTVSAVAVLDLAQELMARNILHAEELGDVSTSLVDCFNAFESNSDLVEQRLPEADLVSLWNIAGQRQPQCPLGIEIGLKVNPDAKGILAHWISCCDSLGEVFEVFHRNVRLLNSAEQWQQENVDDRMALTFDLISDYEYPQMALERSMVAFLAWGEYFCGRKIPLLSATFTFPEPAYGHNFRRCFGDSVIFGHTQNSLVLNEEIFQWPVISANRYLRELLESRSQSVNVSNSMALTCVQRVQELLKEDLTRYSHQTSVCSALHMSRASLYRKLKAEGVQFSDLVQQARDMKLKALQADNTDPESSALALGFSDVSSYYRFLKRTSD